MSVRWRRIALWGTICGLVVAGVVFALWPRPVLVDLATAARGPMKVTVGDEGMTRVREVFVVSSPIAGRIRRIDTDVGDVVAAGKTVVARIEPSDPSLLDVRTEAEAKADVRTAEAAKELAEANLTDARAQQEFAAAELERAHSLVPGRTISRRALELATREYKTRTAAVATAKANLQMRLAELARAKARLVSPVETSRLHGKCDCVPIPAPVDGRILRIVRKSEGVVAAGDPLLEIGDPRDLEIVVDLLSSDAVKVRPGQHAIIEDWGGEGPLAGKVRRVEPYGFTKVSALGIEEQRVNVIIDLVDPPDRWRRLGHGYRVEAAIVLWEREDALSVPLTALFRDGERWAVFVDDRGRARRRHVTLGRRNALLAEIAGGLEEGSRVVVNPGDRIADGVAIRSRP